MSISQQILEHERPRVDQYPEERELSEQYAHVPEEKKVTSFPHLSPSNAHIKLILSFFDNVLMTSVSGSNDPG